MKRPNGEMNGWKIPNMRLYMYIYTSVYMHILLLVPLIRHNINCVFIQLWAGSRTGQFTNESPHYNVETSPITQHGGSCQSAGMGYIILQLQLRYVAAENATDAWATGPRDHGTTGPWYHGTNRAACNHSNCMHSTMLLIYSISCLSLTRIPTL